MELSWGVIADVAREGNAPDIPLPLLLCQPPPRQTQMAQNLPIDTANPLVRDYLTLVRHGLPPAAVPAVVDLDFRRLQVLTPLSLAANIVTILICSIVVNPSIRELPESSVLELGLPNDYNRRRRETVSFVYLTTPMGYCHIHTSAVRGPIGVLRSTRPSAQAGDQGTSESRLT